MAALARYPSRGPRGWVFGSGSRGLRRHFANEGARYDLGGTCSGRCPRRRPDQRPVCVQKRPRCRRVRRLWARLRTSFLSMDATKYSSFDRPPRVAWFPAPAVELPWRARCKFVTPVDMRGRQFEGFADAGGRSNTGRCAALLLILAVASCSGKKRHFADDWPVAAGSAGNPMGESMSPEDAGPAAASRSSVEPAAETTSNALPIDPRAAASGLGCDSPSGICPPRCQGCTIDGDCVAAGLANSTNACQVCDPARNGADWSSNEGAECDDGRFCTVDDRCGGATCAGPARICDDAVACNGVSECDEAADACTDGQVQCQGGTLCDTSSGDCVSTCNGCNVAGVCLVDGFEQAGNPCQVCDVTRSTTSFSPAVDKPCGSAASACSAQDFCDLSGTCQPNHALEGTPCGNGATSACNTADSCDGRGACSANVAANTSACDDGQFCSVNDQCQGGVCVSNGQRDCGALRSCDEATNQCRCTGCAIGGECVVAGTLSPTNSCQVCDPGRSVTAFSPRGEGAFCGEGEQCSATSLCRFTGVGLLSAGFWDTCVIRNGAVFCRSVGGPIDLGADTTALQISTGQHHTCALLATGAVRCWSDSLGSDLGQLGTTSVSSEDGVIFAGTVQLGGRAVFISAGTDYNCAVLDTGKARCWGRNTIGQLGYGHTRNVGDEASDFPFQDIDVGNRRIVQLDAGSGHTCAILDGGAVRCWGSGLGGALGYGNVTNLPAPPSTDVDVGARVHQIATGSSHTCAVIDGGSLRCWGSNDSGQLGYGHTQNIGDDETPAQAATRMVPQDPAVPNGPMRLLGGNVPVGGPVQHVQIRQGLRDGLKTCALLGGGVRCWGSGAFGGLGYAHRNNIGDNETPAEAAAINARRLADGSFLLLGGDLALGGIAVTLAEGGDQCALRSDGQVFCWRGPEQVPTLEDF